MHQNCTCQSPLQCICTGDGDVTYLLGDMDLLSLDKEGADLIYTLDEWEKMAYHDPAGTIGMKPPEVGIILHNILLYVEEYNEVKSILSLTYILPSGAVLS